MLPMFAVHPTDHNTNPNLLVDGLEVSVAPVHAKMRRAGRAEQIMWEHFQRERTRGRLPTGAELDRIAGTKDYGRGALRRWRRTGRIEPTPECDRRNLNWGAAVVGA